MKRYTFLLFCILAWACASVKAPEGGPRDRTRPILKSSSPQQHETLFSKKSIILEFNEEVEENNPKKLFLSPITILTTKDLGKKLELKPDSGWKANTTYVLQLRNKIKDKTEGNLGPDTSLIFSTGQWLDKEELNFQIKSLNGSNLETQTTIIMQDSVGRKFQVISDSTGIAIMKGLGKGKYRIQSFIDRNENYNFEEDEKFLFDGTCMVPDSSRKEVYLLPNSFKPVKLFKQRKGDTLVVEASTYIKPDPIWDNITVGKSTQNTIYRLFPIKNAFIHSYTDSLGNCYTDTINMQQIDSLRSLPTINFEKKYTIEPEGRKWEVNLESNYSLAQVPDSIWYTQDSIWQKVENFSTTRKGVKMNFINLRSGWMKLRFDKVMLFDGTVLAKDSFQIQKQDLNPPGIISGKIETNEKNPVIVQLINVKTKEAIRTTIGKEFKFLIIPGTYRIQVFADWNRDGQYTGGNKEARRTAEPLYVHPQLVELKPGWDLENIQIKTWF